MGIRPKARLAAAALLCVFAAELCGLAWRTGVAYDEPPHIAAAYIYPRAGLGFFTSEHPPLTDYFRSLPLAALPLAMPRAPGRRDIIVNPHELGQHFLLRNRVPPRTILRAARLSSVALALGLALGLWRWAAAAGGADGAWALAFLVFEPNLLAHGSLATTEIGVTAFCALALWAWSRWLDGRARPWAWAAGAFAGAAAASKATGLGLAPAMACAWGWLRLSEPGPRRLREDARGIAGAVAAGAAVLALVYAPAQLPRFFEMVAYRARMMRDPTSVWFFGRTCPHGHPLYYIGALAVKTTAPLLALTLYALFSGRLRREQPASFRCCASMMGVVLAAALAGGRQLGIRYVLPMYPLACLLAGLAAAGSWRRGKTGKLLAGAALAWHAAGALAVLPHPLAYFNELAGGPANGYKILGDSNLDWGQALPDLARFMKRRPGGLILSYFGRDCPGSYGLSFQDAFSTPGPCFGSRTRLPQAAKPVWLAVSATKWQGFYEPGEPAWGWLRTRRPAAMLGYSMFVYDITGDTDAYRRLDAMYARAAVPADSPRRDLKVD